MSIMIAPRADRPTSPYWVETEDWHTAGEPFRIVQKLPDGFLPQSSTVAQRRLDIINAAGHPLDQLRQSLCHEPRGHADMYGCFITPPNDADAHFGVLFWHKDGFSTARGHGTMALGYWAITHGLVKAPEKDGEVEVVIDVPSGRVIAIMAVQGGKPVSASFISVASFQLAKSLPVRVEFRSLDITVEVSFAGAVYASLEAAQLGLTVEPQYVNDFISLGREIKAALGKRAHCGEYDCYGVIFFDEEGDDANTVRQRSVTVFADGQIDRSPCGSGTAARLAVLLAQGRIRVARTKLCHRSIIASEFEADIMSDAESPMSNFPACIPRVKGAANLVGRMKFLIDPGEAIYPGFLLR